MTLFGYAHPLEALTIAVLVVVYLSVLVRSYNRRSVVEDCWTDYDREFCSRHGIAVSGRVEVAA